MWGLAAALVATGGLRQGTLVAQADPGDIVSAEPVYVESEVEARAPRVGMRAGVLRTFDGRTLWSRDAQEELPMASTTKIMTALVVLEHADLSETVTVTERATQAGEAEVDLVPGQRLTVEELLQAMLVRSANDAACALAEHVAGSAGAFVALMNAKAESLGLTHTSFANPHGLDAPGHHTSAEDLATLATVAMADARFAAIVSQRSVSVSGPGGTRRYESSNRLLETYPGATGVKTGWTDDAGFCVVASAERSGVRLLAVVLGASSDSERFEDARALLDWGFEHYRRVKVASAETTAALVPVEDYLDRTVPVVVQHGLSVDVFDLDGAIESRVQVAPVVKAPVARGQRVGMLTVVQGDRLLAQVPLVAAKDVPRPGVFEQMGIWVTRIWHSILGDPAQAAPVLLM